MPPPVTLLGVGPSEIPATGGHLTLRVGVHPTPFGQALLAVTERGVSSLQFLDSEEELLQFHGARATQHEDPRQPHALRHTSRAAPPQLKSIRRAARKAPLTLERALGELGRAWPGVPIVEDPEGTAVTLLSVFWAGRGRRRGERTVGGPASEDRRGRGGTGTAAPDGPSDRAHTPSLASLPAAPVSLYVRGTDFQLQVWRALLEVPPGEITTYGRLAEAVGRPGAARAVGGAVAANPVAYLIPCHRVVRTSGELGGYRWGVERKRAMLEWERALPSTDPR